MRVLRITAAFISFAAWPLVAYDSPFFRLKQTTSNGILRVIGTNTSHSPIVAYVVVFERANQRAVWRGVYPEGDTLASGQSVRVGLVPAGSYLGRPNVATAGQLGQPGGDI